MGRLFDAVSSLLCLRHATNFEGQAAVELEQIADRDSQQRYVFDVSDDGSIIRAQNVIRAGRRGHTGRRRPRNYFGKVSSCGG
jgi:hydrogenase maturation factor HypF (carbamoyltransferase family)